MSAGDNPKRKQPEEPAGAADVGRRSGVGPAVSDFPVVGIGASAGGLAAFEAFFSAMPTDTDIGVAFVLVQHLAPDHKSILSELIRRYTRMQVFEVEDGVKVQPDCAYIIPPNRDMAYLNGTLHLLEPTEPRGIRMPIDFFFRSLAQDLRERAIGIVLSGSGSDGTLGLLSIKGEGGMIMAQHPDSTEHDGMPRRAIATGLVDYVLPPDEMPAQLRAYVAHAFGKRPRPAAPPTPTDDDTRKKICVLLRSQTGHDFSQYKQTTMIRRVERRMAIHQIEHQEDYLRFLQLTPAEVQALFRALLIGVTRFFRDPEAFAALGEQVIPRLFADRQNGGNVRIWVPSCSTGEEAYSIAILLREHMESLEQDFGVLIFATDIDCHAIAQARAGVFPASIAADVSPERLARFFVQEPTSGLYRVQAAIRDLLIFSEHDVIKDPIFSRLDLISCRNLLIYLDGALQMKLIPLFHYALSPGGWLFLGTSETVGEHAALFASKDRKWKLYQRKEDADGAPGAALSASLPPLCEAQDLPRTPLEDGRDERRLDLRAVTEQGLLQHYAKSAALVNARGDIRHIFGRTGKYLEPAPGDAAVNILQMAREGLRRELATALHRTVSHKEPVRYPGLRVRTNGDFITADLTVRPVMTAGEIVPDLYLVILEEVEGEPQRPADQPGQDAEGSSPSATDTRIAGLEQELRSKEEYLQAALEEMQTSNEELKSTNEEMQSVNEELQATNEELETSKEELQSVNEELSTVNAELQNKVAELSRANNDMNNLLAGTGVGTLFVDNRLCISRFTPATTQVINLIQADIGRPVGHIVSNLVGYDRLVEDVRDVLETLVPMETELQTKAGTWFLMRIRPYRTLENTIEGAVLTFLDITELRKAREARPSEARPRLPE